MIRQCGDCQFCCPSPRGALARQEGEREESAQRKAPAGKVDRHPLAGIPGSFLGGCCLFGNRLWKANRAITRNVSSHQSPGIVRGFFVSISQSRRE